MLGEGSYSVVIELKLDGDPSVRLAGKVFKIHGSAEDKLTKEIDVMVQLKHPNIVAYKGVYFQPDVTLPVLVMERLMTSLHTYLLHRVKSNLQLKRKIFILLDTARGLEYLHSLTPAIIHRHLTAKNVLLDSQLRAKIADFGNSRIMELHSGSTPESITKMPGTQDYMPPEAVGMSVKYGPNLDVFSFGHLSLFTIIQSRVQPLLPHNYTDPNDVIIARSEVERREKFMERANELLLEGHPLLELITQCLSNQSARRPSAAELVARLHAVKSSSSEVKELQKEVLEACRYGMLDVIRMAGKIKNCITNDEHGDTPLHYSAFHGQKRIVEYLLDEECFDVESKNKFENTPLHRAARQGHLKIVKYLVEEKGSDPMAVCGWRRTPLHNACKTGELEVVKYLMSDPRVDRSAKDNSVQQQTPLQLAAEHGTVKVVQYMMENGVDREEPGPYTLLHLAAYGGKLDIVQYLIQKRNYDPMIRNKDENTPLHSACVNGELKVVKYLLEECEVEVSKCNNRYQESPLGSAAKSGQMKVVKYLVEEIIEHGVNNQNTALHSAAWGGALDAVKYFIYEKNCSPSCRGRKGRMPLHTACYNGKREVVDYLVDQHNVEVSCEDHDGATPLHLAAKGGHLPLVKTLVRKHKCDHGSRDNTGKTPLHYAYKANHTTTVTYLHRIQEITSGKLS